MPAGYTASFAAWSSSSSNLFLLLKAASSGPRMLTWWFCTLGNNHGTSRNWESSTWQPDSELHHLKALRIGWLWHWLMSKPCVQNKWVKCVPPLDFSFSPNKRTWLAWLLFLILLDSLTRFFFFLTSLATLTTVLEPTCNHLMHCTAWEKKRGREETPSHCRPRNSLSTAVVHSVWRPCLTASFVKRLN